MSAIEDPRPNTKSLEQWTAAVAEARHILVSRAIAYEFTQRDMHYSDFAKVFSTFRLAAPRFTNLPRLLEAVSRLEHEHGRPMLSVLVVRQQDDRPGDGFYGLARSLGWRVDDEEQFFANEHRRVTEYWKGQRLTGGAPPHPGPLPWGEGVIGRASRRGLCRLLPLRRAGCRRG